MIIALVEFPSNFLLSGFVAIFPCWHCSIHYYFSIISIITTTSSALPLNLVLIYYLSVPSLPPLVIVLPFAPFNVSRFLLLLYCSTFVRSSTYTKGYITIISIALFLNFIGATSIAFQSHLKLNFDYFFISI